MGHGTMLWPITDGECDDVEKYQDVVLALGLGATPVAGVVVTVTYTGTTTPASLYSANSLSSPISGNSVTSNVSGIFYFYTLNGRYDFNFYLNGLLVNTVTDVLIQDVNGVGTPTVLPSSTGTIWNNGGALSTT